MSTDDQHLSNGTYNYEHFGPSELIEPVRNYSSNAPRAGEEAPAFKLKDASGHEWNIEDLRDRPVVIITGSASCPMTRGSMPGLKQVYEDFGDATHWFTLYVREAHPGEKLPAHESYEQKIDHAEFLRRAEGIPWPILVDHRDGAVHQKYGLLPNAVFVIGTDGRISFREKSAHAPTLRAALDELVAQGSQGTVLAGDDSRMHMLGATAYGWRAIERAGATAVEDVSTNLPPLAINLWLGHKLTGALDPVARRSTPVPLPVKAGAAAAAAALAGLGVWALIRRNRD